MRNSECGVGAGAVRDYLCMTVRACVCVCVMSLCVRGGRRTSSSDPAHAGHHPLTAGNSTECG